MQLLLQIGISDEETQWKLQRYIDLPLSLRRSKFAVVANK